MRLLLILFLGVSSFCFAQNKNFDIEIHYGLQYFHGAKYEQDPSEVPAGFLSWYDKNQIGSVFGSELNWNLKKGKSKSSIGAFYERQFNVGKQNAQFYTDQGTLILIRDFKLRDINNYFGLHYKYKVSEKMKLLIGAYFVNESRQEISYFASLDIDERNVHNSNLQDGGLCFGVEYYFYNSGSFSLGIKSKLFWTISIGSIDMINLTPSLKYNF